MSRYITNILALFICSMSFAQVAEIATDTISKKESYGLRLGVDLSKPIRMLLEDDYQGFEIVGDFRLTEKFYIAAELGNEKKTVDEDQLNFTTEGSYIKIGFDYNAYENWFGMQNAIYAGLRYGFSTHKQTLNRYQVYQTNQHVDDVSVLTQTPGTEFSNLNGHWIEVVAGIKVEVLHNIYMGFSLRLNRLLSTKEPENFQNLFIPGFNKVTTDNNVGAGFNYTISYSIPLYKKAKKKKKEEEVEE